MPHAPRRSSKLHGAASSSTVVGLFYDVAPGRDKLAVAQRALDEANHFLDITRSAKPGRIRACRCDQSSARPAATSARSERCSAGEGEGESRTRRPALPRSTHRVHVAEETAAPAAPGSQGRRSRCRGQQSRIRSALASLKASQAETLNAWGGLAAGLALNYSYGIDAPQFASHGPDGVLNRGFSASATVDIPIWDWLDLRAQSERSPHSRRGQPGGADRGATPHARQPRRVLSRGRVAQQQLASLDASVADAQEALRLTNLRYVNGESYGAGCGRRAKHAGVRQRMREPTAWFATTLALAQLATLTGRL